MAQWTRAQGGWGWHLLGRFGVLSVGEGRALKLVLRPGHRGPKELYTQSWPLSDGGDPKESPLSSHWLGGQACCLLCGSFPTPPPFWAEEPHLEPWCSGGLRGRAGELATAARRVTVLAHAEPAQGLGPPDGRCWIQASPLPRDVRRKPAVPAPGGLTSEDTWPGRFTSHRVCATLS